MKSLRYLIVRESSLTNVVFEFFLRGHLRSDTSNIVFGIIGKRMLTQVSV